MEWGFDLSKIAAGLGLFLLGMNFLEEALRKLGGRAFKLFLRKQTTNRFKAVAGGAVVTSVLQSSSVVNLMVLAFVGAGILTMQNALAIILGANIGTTITSWIVVTLGFKFEIEMLAYPLVGIFGVALAFFKTDHRLFTWSKFLLGFGLLFVGLGFVKSGFEVMATHFDFTKLQDYPLIIFVLTGFVFTLLIQSSSATIAITLAALHNEALSLIAAMAIVLGAEVGTTIKLVLASFNGIPAKKRVALGNLVYNITVILLVLIALKPVEHFIVKEVLIRDNLLALVFFQSGINFFGLILFFPFLNFFGRMLDKRFTTDEEGARYIKAIPAATGGDLALDALNKETRRLIMLVADFNLAAFDTSNESIVSELNGEAKKKGIIEKYDFIKTIQGEILAYSLSLSKDGFDDADRELVERLSSSVRNSMFAAKSIKDSLHDIEQFKNSSNDVKYTFYLEKKENMKAFYTNLVLLIQQPGSAFEGLVGIFSNIQHGYTRDLNTLYGKAGKEKLNELEISTMINFIRELYSSHKAILWAAKDYLLNKEQSKYFSELPGFIR